MRRRVVRWMVVSGLLAVGGCVSPFTRLPTLWPRHTAVEKKSFEYHDPYPDRNMGPDIDQRPRGFNTQRTPERQNLELKQLQMSPDQPDEGAQSMPPEMKYPGVVRP